MKFAVYGVSRSGKDYFIEKLQLYFSEQGVSLKHIKGSETLNEFAFEKYGVKFKHCDESQKNKLRKKFIAYVAEIEKSYAYVAVDGHYAFYNENCELYSVCTESDINCYEQFFYIDTEPSVVAERMRNSVGEKKNTDISEERIRCWQDYEIDGLTTELLAAEKELHIIKYDNELALEYVFNCVTKNMFDSRAIAKSMVEKLNIDASCVILTDCDRTLSFEDSATFAFDFMKKSKTFLKEIYKNDRYSNYQLWRAQLCAEELGVYTDESMNYSVKNITPNADLINDLRGIENACIIGITAGNGELWNRIAKKFDLPITILAHKKMLVSKYVKYYVVKELQAKGKFVIALGDSLLDGLMLKQANKSYIVTAKGHRSNVEKFLNENKSIRQLGYFPLCYSGVPHDKKISTLKTLSATDAVSEAISVCKSGSGITGKKLRDAHYFLGKKIAQIIQSDFPKSRFAIVCVMRSGLPFSFGLADYFDCPILFCNAPEYESFEKQLQDNPQLNDATFVICDAVINSGKTMKRLLKKLQGKNCVVATSVLSDKFDAFSEVPLYAARVSAHSYTGAKRLDIADGKGPDTADRLFGLL